VLSSSPNESIMVKLDRKALQDTQKSRVREQDDHAAGMKASPSR